MNTIDLRPQSEEVKKDEETPVESSATETSGEETPVAGEETPPETPEDSEENIPLTKTTEEETPEETTETPTEEDPKEINALTNQKEKLLTEITDLRRQRREERYKPDTPLFIEETSKELEDVAPADVELIEKVLKTKGYIRKDELEANSWKSEVNQKINTWIKDNPEFSPENDKEDVLWKQIDNYVTTTFKSPKDPSKITKYLDLAKSELFPKSFPQKQRATVDAQKEKIKNVSKTSVGGGSKAPRTSTPINKSLYSGFTDEELAEMET